MSSKFSQAEIDEFFEHSTMFPYEEYYYKYHFIGSEKKEIKFSNVEGACTIKGLEIENKDWASAISNVVLTQGSWYYEMSLLEGKHYCCQYGWTKPKYKPTKYNGVGDMPNSYGLDLGRSIMYKNGSKIKLDTSQKWKTGDVIGFYLSLSGEDNTMWFTHNGQPVRIANGKDILFITDFDVRDNGLIPAVTISNSKVLISFNSVYQKNRQKCKYDSPIYRSLYEIKPSLS